ncbi:MAG: MlaD family protein, partial [Terrimicrobiaceae bacterium]|nr:MlaD family protein [Terrimicrobiaceae bacterium]
MKLHGGSDWIIALVVILCSAVLFIALASALSGAFLGAPSRTIEADFPDVTGVGVHSEVRFAGAPAGTVARLRILTPSERAQSPVPGAAVRVTMALRDGVPPLLEDTRASIASDTILSEKFILLSPGTPGGAELPEGKILAGAAPVTLDEFLRRADRIITAADGLLGGEGSTASLLEGLQAAMGEARSLIAEARGAVTELRALVGDAAPLPGEIRPVLSEFRGVAREASGLFGETRPRLERALANLENASRSLDRLAANGASFLASNEKNAAALLAELRIAAQNAKIAATWARVWIASLNRRPSQLIWGNRR